MQILIDEGLRIYRNTVALITKALKTFKSVNESNIVIREHFPLNLFTILKFTQQFIRIELNGLTIMKISLCKGWMPIST